MNETLTNHCLTPSKMPKNRPIIALHANDPCILGVFLCAQNQLQLFLKTGWTTE